MTREEAIELLDDLDGAIEDNQGRDYDEALRMAIESLQDDWIPCECELPKKREDGKPTHCLVTLNDNCSLYDKVYDAFFRVQKDGEVEWVIGEFHIVSEYVTAWKPLPTPYKGGEDE